MAEIKVSGNNAFFFVNLASLHTNFSINNSSGQVPSVLQQLQSLHPSRYDAFRPTRWGIGFCYSVQRHLIVRKR